jgi:hypothetical protein
VRVLTGELNEFAQAMERSEKTQQQALGLNLKTIEDTFQKCDDILRDVKLSVSSVGAASAGAMPTASVSATPQQASVAELRPRTQRTPPSCTVYRSTS